MSGAWNPDLAATLQTVANVLQVIDEHWHGQLKWSADTGPHPHEASTLLLLQDEGAPQENYYINEHGRMQVNAPWYGPEYHRMCTEVEWDDLELS